MDIVFVTHNKLGLACLEELSAVGADIRAVYTRPEREDISDQVPIDSFAEEQDVPLHRVDSINSDSVKTEIAGYDPELLFVVGWSQLVDSAVLDIPSVAALGMHPAPLPRGRGRAPLAWSMIKGLDQTALSFFHLVEAADAGDLVGQEPLNIALTDDASSLYEKMVEAGRTLIREYYPQFEPGAVPRTPQDEDEATWWPKRDPWHGLIGWNRSPQEVYDWIRGQTRPYPGAFSYLDDQKVTVWAARPPDEETAFARPGEIVARGDETLTVGAWEGLIELSEVEVEDDGPVPASALVSEYDFNVGDTFSNARDRLRDEG
jgi:methionyl-tRNA formyltransferase